MTGPQSTDRSDQVEPRPSHPRLPGGRAGRILLIVALVSGSTLASGSQGEARSKTPASRFKLHDRAGSSSRAGAICKYEGSRLAEIVVRAPFVKALSSLPDRPGTDKPFHEQYFAWNPVIQSLTGSRWHNVKEAPELAESRRVTTQSKFVAGSPRSRRVKGFANGVFRAAVRITWYNPRKAGAVDGRALAPIENHFNTRTRNSLPRCVNPLPDPAPGSAPSPPSSLTATSIGSDRVDLAWEDTSSSETGFDVERSLDGTNFSPLYSTAANMESATDDAVAASTTYYYRVRAFNSYGSSAASDVATTTTQASPPSPVVHYDCPNTNGVGKYVPPDHYWQNPFTTRGAVITGGWLLLGANSDGGDHRAKIGIYTGPNRAGPLGEVVQQVTGYDGESFTFPTPIRVTPGQTLYVTVTGVGDLTAYDNGCFIGRVDGFSE